MIIRADFFLEENFKNTLADMKLLPCKTDTSVIESKFSFSRHQLAI